jgi:hypothetical protein
MYAGYLVNTSNKEISVRQKTIIRNILTKQTMLKSDIELLKSCACHFISINKISLKPGENVCTALVEGPCGSRNGILLRVAKTTRRSTLGMCPLVKSGVAFGYLDFIDLGTLME